MITRMVAACAVTLATTVLAPVAIADASLPNGCPPGYAHQGDDVGTHSLNSIAKLSDALTAGFEIETDLRPTADKGLVIFHNATLDGATRDGVGAVNDVTFAYATSRHYRDGSTVASWDELLNLLAAFPGHRAIVEVKPSPVWTHAMLQGLASTVAARGLTGQVTFDSQLARYLPTIDSGAPAVETAVKHAENRTAAYVLSYADAAVASYTWPAAEVTAMHNAGANVYLSSQTATGWSVAVSEQANGILTKQALELMQWCASM